LYLGVPLVLWPVGAWISSGDNSFDLKCGDQWTVEIYYRKGDSTLACKEVLEQVSVTFTGTPPENRTKELEIEGTFSCRKDDGHDDDHTAVVTDGSSADKTMDKDLLMEMGALSYYMDRDGTGPTTCWPGGVYKVDSPAVKLWVKEIGITSAFNSWVQSIGITLFFGCAVMSWGFWGCMSVLVCLLSEEPAGTVQPPPSQMQMQQQSWDRQP